MFDAGVSEGLKVAAERLSLGFSGAAAALKAPLHHSDSLGAKAKRALRAAPKVGHQQLLQDLLSRAACKTCCRQDTFTCPANPLTALPAPVASVPACVDAVYFSFCWPNLIIVNVLIVKCIFLKMSASLGAEM